MISHIKGPCAGEFAQAIQSASAMSSYDQQENKKKGRERRDLARDICHSSEVGRLALYLPWEIGRLLVRLDQFEGEFLGQHRHKSDSFNCRELLSKATKNWK